MAEEKKERLEFRGGMFMSLIPVAIVLAVCIVLCGFCQAGKGVREEGGGGVGLLDCSPKWARYK